MLHNRYNTNVSKKQIRSIVLKIFKIHEYHILLYLIFKFKIWNNINLNLKNHYMKM